MWGTIALMGAQALLGANQAKRQQEATKQQNLAEAEKTRYSPWTGQHGNIQTYKGPDAMSGAIGGAIGGLASAQGLGLFGDKSAATADALKPALGDGLGKMAAANPTMGNGMKNVFGAGDMSDQLGMQGAIAQQSFQKPTLFGNR